MEADQARQLDRRARALRQSIEELVRLKRLDRRDDSTVGEGAIQDATDDAHMALADVLELGEKISEESDRVRVDGEEVELGLPSLAARASRGEDGRINVDDLRDEVRDRLDQLRDDRLPDDDGDDDDVEDPVEDPEPEPDPVPEPDGGDDEDDPDEDGDDDPDRRDPPERRT